MSEELKNCPFCGQTEPLYIAEIENLGVWMVECMAEHDGCGASSGMYTSRKEMVEAWNHRATVELSDEEKRSAILKAITSMPHSIDKTCVKIMRDSEQEGNALHQLVSAIIAAQRGKA